MSFNVVFQDVADQDLGPLLTHGAALGYASPVVTPVAGPVQSSQSMAVTADDDLVTEWQLVDQRAGQTYQWPEYLERYSSYDVYLGRTKREGSVYIALGLTERAGAWGRDRSYIVAFLSQRAPQTPLVEFLEADDHAETGELLAVIRGSDGARRMYGPGDTLPAIYAEHFRTEVYRDRVHASGAWNKLAVIAHKDDTPTLLNHALMQARRRGDI
jgi:hypothetical protein